MPVDVMNSLKYVCNTVGGLSNEATDQYLHYMETKRLLQLETWA